MMTLAEWDREVKPYLRTLEASSTWVCYHAQNVASALAALPARPEWPTEADAALAKAEQDLIVALEMTRQARRQYQELATTIDNQQVA